MNDPIDRRSVAALGLAGSAALLASGTQTEAKGRRPQLDAIAEARRHFADVLLRHDHAALPPLFTEDTIVLPAGRPLVQGKTAAIAFWTAATGDPARRLRSTFDAVDSIVMEDLVIEAGHATVFAVEPGGDRFFDNGKYIVVWKREEGRWKRHRDIFNSDVMQGDRK